MWEKLSLEERWRLLGIYIGSAGLAAILAFGWGRSVGIRAAPGEAPPATNTQVFDLNSDKSPPEMSPSNGETNKGEVETSSTVTVHVTGRVKKPGVYTLPRDQRVQDAIQEAGGALADADLEQLNLAAHLEDGDKIEVLPKGAAGSEEAKGERAKAKTDHPTIVVLNRATEQELDQLPGVGPVTAQRILELRRERGKFQSLDELLDVEGIGPKKLEKMRPYLRLN